VDGGAVTGLKEAILELRRPFMPTLDSPIRPSTALYPPRIILYLPSRHDSHQRLRQNMAAG
jgi:hypothetical protein